MSHFLKRENFTLVNTTIAAAWISRELKKLGSGVQILKLNGQNSHQEKERITNLFKDG